MDTAHILRLVHQSEACDKCSGVLKSLLNSACCLQNVLNNKVDPRSVEAKLRTYKLYLLPYITIIIQWIQPKATVTKQRSQMGLNGLRFVTVRYNQYNRCIQNGLKMSCQKTHKSQSAKWRCNKLVWQTSSRSVFSNHFCLTLLILLRVLPTSQMLQIVEKTKAKNPLNRSKNNLIFF